MAVRSSIVTVTTSPTAMTPGTDTDVNQGARDAALKNTGSVTVYLGGPDVTTAAGFPLDPGEVLAFENMPVDALPFGVVSTGTSTVAVLQSGV